MGDRFSIMRTPKGPPWCGQWLERAEYRPSEVGERQRVASYGKRPDSTLRCEGGELYWRFVGLRHHDL